MIKIIITIITTVIILDVKCCHLINLSNHERRKSVAQMLSLLVGWLACDQVNNFSQMMSLPLFDVAGVGTFLVTKLHRFKCHCHYPSCHNTDHLAVASVFNAAPQIAIKIPCQNSQAAAFSAKLQQLHPCFITLYLHYNSSVLILLLV